MISTDYVTKKEGRGIASTKDSFEAFIQRLEDNIKKREGRLITATINNTENTSSNRTKITGKQKWEVKQVYGNFKRQTRKISHEKIGTWLKHGKLKRETESLLIAAQNNPIWTNNVKARIEWTQENSRCKLCGDRDETRKKRSTI